MNDFINDNWATMFDTEYYENNNIFSASWFKYWRNRLRRSKKYLLTKRVIQFLRDAESTTILTPDERAECVKLLRRNLVGVFNAPFILKYMEQHKHINVAIDVENGLPYVLTENGTNLYFKRGMSKRRIRKLYNSLRAEQDELSPHNYCFDSFTANSDSIFADCGAAEGIFTLKFIATIKKAYLFEADAGWVEALNATFAAYKEKIVIVNKFVSCTNDGDCVSLDSFFRQQEKPTLLKMDVEGAERDVLNGATELLQSDTISDVLVTVYHKKNDKQELTALLQQKGYKVTSSPGHMLFLPDPNFSPYPPFDFRSGLIHGVNCKKIR
jgi:hypothetical protein